MVQTIIKKSQAPLDSRDLEICQDVFDDLRTMADVPRNSEEAERIAAIVVEIYRQGVHNPEHLKTIVQAARGLFEKQPALTMGRRIRSIGPLSVESEDEKGN
ncbi:hypothetical protein [Rhizobium vallis]|uniref:hypothetical protein n=1 Tax=Rhizobium vallis TaxID=634290 RepID=UPI001FE08650|nr:hypothetical protein [Rhizobium vallis]